MRRIAISFLVLGCASAPPPSEPVVRFPNQAALATLQAQPVALPPLKVPPVPPVAWTVENAAAAHFEASTAEGNERALAALFAAAGKPLRLTKAASCVAREVGRYYLDHEAAPGEGLREFMLGACGSLAREVGLIPYVGPVPEKVPDAVVLRTWSEPLEKAVASTLPKDASEVGVWFGRKGDKAMAVISYVKLPASVRPFSLAPDGNGDVLIEGSLPGKVAYYSGYINHGRFGVDPCFVDPTVAKPGFRISCHLHEGDSSAWVQLLYTHPGRVLSLPFAQFIVRRDPAAPVEYRPPPAGEARPAATAPEFARLAVEELNRVRREAELQPVRLADLQSTTAGQLAPRYFAAAMAGTGNLEVMDTIALGLLAGWQVGGLIRDANFVSEIAPATHDVGRWLDQALAMPSGRVALLDATIEEVALGPAFWSSPDMLGGLVVGYRFHHGNDHASDVKRLLMRVVAARRQRALSPPARLAKMDEVMREELARVHDGRAHPQQALQDILEWGVARFGAGMRGYVVEAASLDAVEFPADIIEQPTLHLEIGVTHHKPPGAAWAQLVIAVVFVDYPSGPKI
jgi:hypothetical protein